ncbi:Lrp/AsnC family transcriptional regulator [Terasakiella pusilla]|jgi:Lrp/AsnC family leucine-responsive transcriptional regulator|uniref:Lrp/AsnC family transcriptional regulator n=1 Tax=Terasakiella pusilla TaxID=64973 RepID=UPI00048A80A1|nr:Lrp/AsnC family transcriptional regulator [Terasakiella pusilla]
MGNLPTELDKTDRLLLNLLQKNNRLSAETLADRVGSSRSSVQRRIKRLRKEGVIEADLSVLSSKILNNRVQAIVDVKLESVRGELLDKFRQSMLELDVVQQCYYVTGEVDFIVILCLDNMQEYDQITRKYFADAPNIRRYHSSIVSDRVKVNLNVPLKV